ncbi:cysteine desulfurase NifS [Halothiobacillus diazotrophicus]|uniref:cysteine desulfurase n=1 Tax=Halothiobacillus diazotrophicus TaxID=1860122 RepID=A0A191ZEH6_9GAMM|nr:cysteine desulfurase family protein [Halothiobacillus diazotrophicus]ANJ66265.1 cysteine desulfurase NifS [Halothiobacillus diazotrophicus]
MSEPRTVYLDNNATTPLAPEALTAMLPYLSTDFANPSSASRAGTAVKEAIAGARADVAALLGCRTSELVFTSGATESNHMAMLGALAMAPEKRHLITSTVEHPSVLLLCRHLEQTGVEVTYLPVDASGQLNLAELRAAIRPDTALISLMWANNETGVVFPIPDIAEMARAAGVPLHVDGTQVLGKMPLDLASIGVLLFSCSAHKVHGPKGIGALYIQKGLGLPPLIYGHQERGRRGGTENVPGIIGFAAAARLMADIEAESVHLRVLRDRLEQGVLDCFPTAMVHGQAAERLPNTVNIAFRSIEAEELLHRLDQRGIVAATGAACAAGGSRPSHVLSAMGISRDDILTSLRFSVGRYNSRDDVEQLIRALIELVPTAEPAHQAAPATPHAIHP